MKKYLVLTMPFFVLATMTTKPTFAHGPRVCAATSMAVKNACGLGANKDYWINLGKCKNLTNAAENSECKKNALTTQTESFKLCRVQFKAREGICDSLGQGPYDPVVDPANFVDPTKLGKSVAPNAFFPLVPGRTLTYQGGDETITITTTHNTKVIMGVTCIEVHDVVRQNGTIIEDTLDWYAQDVQGNVWYFGEVVMNYENGLLANLDGSWIAGVKGDKPGIIMKAAPAVGQLYRQEYSIGNAEDMAKIISLTGTEKVPAATCDNDCLVTVDFTPFTPETVEHKYYKPGIGFVLEIKPGSGERKELIKIENN